MYRRIYRAEIVAFTLFTYVLSGIFIYMSGFTKIHAQELRIGIAHTYEISDEGIEDGDIISMVDTSEEDSESSNVVLQRSSKSYDEKIFGIYVESPTMVLRTGDDNLPVVREGDAYVNVSTIKGPIQRGDPVTSSQIPGKGQQGKGISGIIVGIALEDHLDGNGQKVTLDDGQDVWIGRIRVALGIGDVQPLTTVSRGGIIGLVNQLGLSILQALEAEGGSKILRYMIAGLVAVITVLVSFFTFGKNITKGIEAIGRNPIAKVQIQSMIFLNVVLIALVTIGGIVLTLILINF